MYDIICKNVTRKENVMINNKLKTTVICITVVTFCIIMAMVDGILKADYFTKSAIKLILFMCIPIIYGIWDKEIDIKSLFIINRRGFLITLPLCLGVYIVIVGGYLLLRSVFDFSAITGSLTSNIGVNKSNFVYVSLYISFINSLLEEFFFRGIAFLSLSKVSSKCFAYLFSAFSFSVYHIAMMIGWFSVELFIIVLAGLFAGGLIFNYLNEKSGTLYPSWLVHMFANFAINTVGFILFGII